MKEIVCQFGPNESLLGVLTTPDDDKRVEGSPIALILNAGIVHRVGPFRLHVKLARQLAENGVSTLRMDLSGLGDSSVRTGQLGDNNRAVLDVSDAMDYLSKQTGVNEFVLLGMCSGAYNAHQVSVKDDRIVGAVFMDGIVFRTFGYYWRSAIRRKLRPRFWRNAIKRRFANLDTTTEEAGESLAATEFFFANELKRDDVMRDLQGLMNRGVRMLFLYTDGYDDICGREQFTEMYGLQPDDQLQVEYYPKSEHTFRLVENRVTVCNRVANWFEGQFSKTIGV